LTSAPHTRSLSQARAAAKLAEEDAKMAKKSLAEESCKLGKVQRRCEFLEDELGRVVPKGDLLEAELEKTKKEIAEREDT
jgi:chromosome segregation ATPase